jgi:hypothetical protein
MTGGASDNAIFAASLFLTYRGFAFVSDEAGTRLFAMLTGTGMELSVKLSGVGDAVWAEDAIAGISVKSARKKAFMIRLLLRYKIQK